MFSRQKTGSVICTSCGKLVGVSDDRCFNCGRWNPGLWGFGPALRALGRDLGFVSIVLWGSTGLYLATLLVDPSGIENGGAFDLLSPSIVATRVFGSSGTVPVFLFGRWWTVLSAAWLHGSLLHIVFNMLWVRQLGPAVADIYGPGRLVILYTVSAITGFTLSTFCRVYDTLGASAPIFGLMGALVYAGRRGIASHLGRQVLGYAILILIMGFVMPRIDNYAHVGGFLGGYVTAALLNPLRPERFEHVIAGLFCIGLTVASIAASVLHGLTLLPPRP